MTVHQAIEGQVCWIPGITPGQIPDELPSGISIVSKANTIGVRSDGLVGSIGLLDGSTIQIRPKIGEASFLQLVSYCSGGRELIEKLATSSDLALGDEGAADLVTRQFVVSVDRALRMGLEHGRKWTMTESKNVAGRIDYLATERRRIAQHPSPILSKSKLRTLEIPENQIVALALSVILGIAPPNEHLKIRGLQKQWPCEPVHHTKCVESIELLENRLIQNRYRGVRDYYRELVGLSLVVLSIAGVGPVAGQTIAGSSYLINTAQVFERFILRAAQTALAGMGYVVSKGGTETKSLYVDGRFVLEPDVVIEKEDRCVGIIDAKYKAPTSSDHYQMMAYVQNFGLKRGALFQPVFENESPGTTTFKSVSGVEVDVVKLNLRSMDDSIRAIENYLRSNF